MAKQKKGIKKPFWERVARKLVRLANKLLPPGKKYTLEILKVKLDIGSDDQSPEIILLEWEANTKCFLDRLWRNAKPSDRVISLYDKVPENTVLPSRKEIELKVEKATEFYKERLRKNEAEFDALEKVSKLKNDLNFDFEMLRKDIKHRIEMFKGYSANVAVCIKFLDELHIFQENMEELKKLIPVKDDVLEMVMNTFVNDVFLSWQRYEKAKSVANLTAVYFRINSDRIIINDLFTQLYPSKGRLEYRDIPVLVAGAQMKQKLLQQNVTDNAYEQSTEQLAA